MEIQAFTEPYRDSVIALWKDCQLVVPQNDPNKDIDRKLLVNPELFLIGLVDSTLVASVMGGYEGHRGWIHYLAVAPEHRQRGYGRTMMQTIETRIQSLGCAKINLQIRQGNSDVIAFYQAIGYGDDRVIGLGKRLVLDGNSC